MSDTKHTPAQAEAVLNANAHLSNAGLATYDDLLEALKAVAPYLSAGDRLVALAAIAKAEGR